MRSQAIYYLNLDAFALGHFLPGVVDGRTFSEEIRNEVMEQG
jgi:hypothetical protein